MPWLFHETAGGFCGSRCDTQTGRLDLRHVFDDEFQVEDPLFQV